MRLFIVVAMATGMLSFSSRADDRSRRLDEAIRRLEQTLSERGEKAVKPKSLDDISEELEKIRADLDAMRARSEARERQRERERKERERVPPGIIAKIKLSPQEQSRWCWAAVVQTLASGLGMNELAQCRMAGYFHYGNAEVCCGVNASSSACNRGHYVDVVMQTYALLAQSYPFLISQSSLSTETTARRPVPLSVSFGTHKHAILVYGVDGDDVYGWDPDLGGDKFVMRRRSLETYKGGVIDETMTAKRW